MKTHIDVVPKWLTLEHEGLCDQKLTLDAPRTTLMVMVDD
jgi:hypothetical protein